MTISSRFKIKIVMAALLLSAVSIELANATENFWIASAPKKFNRPCAEHLKAKTSAIKIFSENYEARIEESTTMGEENEGYIARNIGREGVAKLIATTLTNNAKVLNVATERIGSLNGFPDTFQISYKNEDGREQIITVKGDNSLPHLTNSVDIEVTSPIMLNHRDVEVYDLVLAELAKVGFFTDPNVAGLHFHFGIKNFRSTEIAVLMLIFDMIHPELENILNVGLERRQFNRPLTREMHKYLRAVSQIYAAGESERAGWILAMARDGRISEHRNHGLNILNLGSEKIGTVEFRIANSTLKQKSRDALREFFKRFVMAVRSKNAKLIEEATHAELSGKLLKIETVFNILALDFDQFLIDVR